jgi:hypothetical protein
MAKELKPRDGDPQARETPLPLPPIEGRQLWAATEAGENGVALPIQMTGLCWQDLELRKGMAALVEVAMVVVVVLVATMTMTKESLTTMPIVDEEAAAAVNERQRRVKQPQAVPHYQDALALVLFLAPLLDFLLPPRFYLNPQLSGTESKGIVLGQLPALAFWTRVARTARLGAILLQGRFFGQLLLA